MRPISPSNTQRLEKIRELAKLKDFKTCLQVCVDAIQADPTFYLFWHYCGGCLLYQGVKLEALFHYDRAIALCDTDPIVWCDRGVACVNLDMLDEAEKSLRKSISLEPVYLAYSSLAHLLLHTERYEEATEYFKLALSLKDTVPLRMRYGTMLMAQGRWEEGFKLDAARWERGWNVQEYYDWGSSWSCPRWSGEDLNGKKVLLYQEGGHGDAILTLRYARLMADKYPNTDFTLFVDYRMVGLVDLPMRIADNLFTSETFDYKVTLYDVPMVLSMSWQTVPRPKSYINWNSSKWKDRLKEVPPGLNVGLCWVSKAGNKRLTDAEVKQLQLPNVNYFSLQKPKYEMPFPMVEWIDECETWRDTADLVGALDLVISIDTGPAHLAGAMGKPVWCFVGYSNYWPWLDRKLVGDEYCIWYPSMTLLRMTRFKDMHEPIMKALSRLWAMAQKKLHA